MSRQVGRLEGRHARIYIDSFKLAEGRLQKLVTCKQERYLQCIDPRNMILVILYVQPSLCVRACTCHVAKIFFEAIASQGQGPHWVSLVLIW